MTNAGLKVRSTTIMIAATADLKPALPEPPAGNASLEPLYRTCCQRGPEGRLYRHNHALRRRAELYVLPPLIASSMRVNSGMKIVCSRSGPVEMIAIFAPASRCTNSRYCLAFLGS